MQEQREEELFLKRYIQYAKARVHTRLSPEAARILGSRYGGRWLQELLTARRNRPSGHPHRVSNFQVRQVPC